MKRKGQLSPAFKYIFAAIAGFILLIFFIVIAGQYLDFFETKSSTEIAISLNHVLDALLIIEGANKPIEPPFNDNIFITCNSLKFEKGFSARFEKIIFSPSILESNQLNTWTIGWYFPFRVANFFYIANPDTQFFLVYDSRTKSQIERLTSSSFPNYMPPLYRRQAIHINSIDNTFMNQVKSQAKGGRVKFAFFTAPTNENQILSKIPNSEIVYLDVDEDFYGEVTFQEDRKKAMILGLPFVYGAIFSDSSFNYECSVNKALDNLNFLANLYADKALQIRSKQRACNFLPLKDSLIALAELKDQDLLIAKKANVQDLNRLIVEEGCNAVF